MHKTIVTIYTNSLRGAQKQNHPIRIGIYWSIVSFCDAKKNHQPDKYTRKVKLASKNKGRNVVIYISLNWYHVIDAMSQKRHKRVACTNQKIFIIIIQYSNACRRIAHMRSKGTLKNIEIYKTENHIKCKHVKKKHIVCAQSSTHMFFSLIM